MAKSSVKPASARRTTVVAAAVANTGAKDRDRRAAKRTLTSKNIVRTVARCAFAFPVIVRSVFAPKTSKMMREKVMLGVTAVNDSRYCKWGHAHWATSQGVPIDVVNRILSNLDPSLTTSDAGEEAAIRFGQQYAEDGVDADSVVELRKHFSPAQVREILAYVYFITFTNLSGNTVDAVLERLRGEGRPITVVEGAAGVVLAPVLLALLALVKLGKVVGTDKRRAKRNRSPGAGPGDGA